MMHPLRPVVEWNYDWPPNSIDFRRFECASSPQQSHPCCSAGALPTSDSVDLALHSPNISVENARGCASNPSHDVVPTHCQCNSQDSILMPLRQGRRTIRSRSGSSRDHGEVRTLDKVADSLRMHGCAGTREASVCLRGDCGGRARGEKEAVRLGVGGAWCGVHDGEGRDCSSARSDTSASMDKDDGEQVGSLAGQQGSHLAQRVSATLCMHPHERPRSMYTMSNDTPPFFVLITSDLRCSLAARIFATWLLRYLHQIGESARLFVAAAAARDAAVSSFAKDRAAWTADMSRCIAHAMDYFHSHPPLGFNATPVSILYGDLSSAEAVKVFLSLLPPRQRVNVRGFEFIEDAVTTTAAPVLRAHVRVCLSTRHVRAAIKPFSVVCSQVITFLHDVLTCLCRIYAHEPLHASSSLDTLHSFPPIFFVRHGQSEYNLEDRLGGDPGLTAVGGADAEAMARFFEHQVRRNRCLFGRRSRVWDERVGFDVWCSLLRRTRCTAQPIAQVLTGGAMKTSKLLNEIHAGICENMTKEEIEELYPDICIFRHLDKVGYRYPNGESYRDLVHRLMPLVSYLTSSEKCVLVVAHQAVLRALLSFFGGKPVEEAVHTPCPQRTVWVCTYDRVGEPRIAQISLPRDTAEQTRCTDQL